MLELPATYMGESMALHVATYLFRSNYAALVLVIIEIVTCYQSLLVCSYQTILVT